MLLIHVNANDEKRHPLEDDRSRREKRMERKYSLDKRFGFSRIRPSFLLSGVFIVWLVLLGFAPFVIGVTDASPSVSSFKEEAKRAIKTLTASLIDAVSKRNIGEVQAGMDKIISDAEEEGKPIRFGIGILDKNAVAVAGRYVVGIFREEDFSKYGFVKRAFKKKKIVQERLYLQDHSELLIICVPLVQRKNVVGAIVLGFNPAQVKEDYDLNTEQFLTLDLNK